MTKKELEQQNRELLNDIACKVCGMPFKSIGDLYDHYDEEHNRGKE